MKKVSLLAAIFALALSVTACSGKGVDKGAGTVTDADVVIAKSSVTDTAQFIPVEVDGVSLEVIAVKAPDGTIRTAFNTCQVCYDSGRGYYKQEGDVLVCQNCGNRFKTNQVAVDKGGCNPVGISADMRTETDDEITVPLALLQQAKEIFASWKTEY